MTLLLAVMFTPIFQSYKSAEALKIEKLEKAIAAFEKKLKEIQNPVVSFEGLIAAKKAEVKALKKEPLEKSRMLWLSGALAVVIGGLLVSYASAQKKKQQDGELCNTLNWYWVCWLFLYMLA